MSCETGPGFVELVVAGALGCGVAWLGLGLVVAVLLRYRSQVIAILTREEKKRGP